MKLDIYEDHKIVKTYETKDYNLKFGTLEDVLNAIDIDKLKNATEADILATVGELCLNSFPLVKELILDVFEELTEEEMRGALVEDIAGVLVDIVIYTITKINRSFGWVRSKNA